MGIGRDIFRCGHRHFEISDAVEKKVLEKINLSCNITKSDLEESYWTFCKKIDKDS